MLKRLYDPEALLLAMKNGVLILNQDCRVLFFNDAARSLLNLQPVSSDIPQELPKVLTDVVSMLGAEVKEKEAELALSVRGENKYFQILAQLVESDSRQDPEILQDIACKTVLIVLHEVSRLHRLENMRREFVANVSHELKTPITSIKAAVETLQDGAMSDPQVMPRFLDIIARQSDRLKNIIEDLLSLSRLENEPDAIYFIESSVRAVIDEAILDCEDKAKQKKIEIRVEVPLHLRARMNSSLIEQAVMNLVDNAIKYSEPSTVVTVMAQIVGRELEISVRDQGRGIESEHLARIFERFYRVDKARSRNAGGSGLGLSIVKHIAQVHGGRASVSSVPGQGSVFSIHVPVN